jgi:hypothetical protein
MNSPKQYKVFAKQFVFADVNHTLAPFTKDFLTRPLPFPAQVFQVEVG